MRTNACHEDQLSGREEKKDLPHGTQVFSGLFWTVTKKTDVHYCIRGLDAIFLLICQIYSLHSVTLDGAYTEPCFRV